MRFDPKENSPGKRTGHSATIIKDKMYLFGGDTGMKCVNELWEFDIPNRSWTKVEFDPEDKVPHPRCGHASIAYGNTIIFFGGADRL